MVVCGGRAGAGGLGRVLPVARALSFGLWRIGGGLVVFVEGIRRGAVAFWERCVGNGCFRGWSGLGSPFLWRGL